MRDFVKKQALSHFFVGMIFPLKLKGALNFEENLMKDNTSCSMRHVER